jgi:PEP-CTERM motif
MKRLLFSSIVFTALAGGAQAGIVLGTSDPAGAPLIMSAGTTSGSMFVNIASDNAPNDVMSGWNITLTIVPEAGAHGTLQFQDPVTGTVSNPPNYIFGANGIGISATNGASSLSANDFFVGAEPGVAAPGAPGANLLQMDFFATSNASGLFGVYAMEGAALNEWTDGNGNAQLFTNVPDGSNAVRIGDVFVNTQSVPEPSTLVLLGLASAAVAGWHWRRMPKLSAPRRPCRALPQRVG